jgi:uncharacterized protein
MTVYMLDTNVLIALVDQEHSFASAARHWFNMTGSAGFATCPITENALIRIMSHKAYPSGLRPIGLLLQALGDLKGRPGCRFWPDDISLTGASLLRHGHLVKSAYLTDSYLLGLAVRNGGKLATFDRNLRGTAVIGGADALA